LYRVLEVIEGCLEINIICSNGGIDDFFKGFYSSASLTFEEYNSRDTLIVLDFKFTKSMNNQW